MAKLYKNYTTALRNTQDRCEAVTLDNVEGFMARFELQPKEEIAHDTAAWMANAKRHLICYELKNGLFGSLWADEIYGALSLPLIQTLYTTRDAALAQHAALVQSYRKNPTWQA